MATTPRRAADGRKSNGGARKGAGRPKVAVTKLRDEAALAFADMVAKDIPAYYAALKRLALGQKEWRLVDGRRREVYTVEPDRAALVYMVDRWAGRPRQALDVTGSGGIDPRAAAALTAEKGDAYVDPDGPAEAAAEVS